MIGPVHTAIMWLRMDVNPGNLAPKSSALNYKVNIYSEGISYHDS